MKSVLPGLLAAAALATPGAALADDCAAAFARMTEAAPAARFVAYVGFAPVRIDGDGPHWMLVDTGANRSALDARLAARLGLPQLGPERVEGSAGVVEAGATRIDRLEAGGAVIADLSPTTSDLSGLAGPDGEPVAGVLGSDAFAGRALVLDFAGGRIGLARPDAGLAACARVAPFSLENGMVRYPARVDGRSVALRHDSGAGLFETDDVYLNLSTPQFEALVAGGPEPAPLTHFSGSGTGGTVRLPVHQGRRLELGPLSFPSPRLIVQPRQGYFAREDAIGFVGNYVFWREGALVIDYAGGRTVLPPAS